MKNILIIMFAIVILLSCNFKGERAPYNKEFNNIRKDVGLRIIDSTFKNYNVPSNFDFSPLNREIIGVPIFLSEIKKPQYIGKLTYMDKNDGNIIYEEDRFVSGVNKAGVDEDIVESLTLRYVFKNYNYFFKRSERLGGDINKKFSKGWYYIYEYPVIMNTSSNRPNMVYYTLETKIIAENKADSIIKSWNLKRLN